MCRFRRKCIERIERFRSAGCTIVLISHDPDTIRELCDEAIWLNAGQLAAHGAADAVVEQYIKDTELSSSGTDSLRIFAK